MALIYATTPDDDLLSARFVCYSSISTFVLALVTKSSSEMSSNTVKSFLHQKTLMRQSFFLLLIFSFRVSLGSVILL